ncbi:TRAP transporter fused permease subunit [Vibrio sp. V27_P1S3P104]|uniref:TRAP transporter permease n=1 Tax=unclassified Vibrio TaxID=2614977 RepID=UPI00137377A3|nr:MULTISPECIES: TRAP transporter permease [unclassified Vibrio]NAW69150.1 TRAP transporter fused permease subunit [Vibrio sp. V28_P6S34P95]NAX03767.1 TRAP transporter fused permease subunit [Vibrio sp. V30_P3S12P165]NAX33520.1 TRAP transporter fused permease subunit [Vibrio sp. V29_P1S30P107]NAX37418.1 TRAP transporter fused permease subunit [Vibrio sp. V27_P1S3P104]NAX40308.1 TRAP transporter fused permease subunit [Vibrio sp. V26_P1S5P106]
MTQANIPSQDVQEMVAQADTGARNPKGLPGRILWFVPLCWSLFQLWYASPLPFIFDFAILNDTQARSIHLSFAVFLAFTAYPALKNSSREHIPLTDWLLALAGSFSAAYIYLFYASLAGRSGAPTTPDIIISVTGMLLLLEATRRALGPPLMCVAGLFLFYTFAGPYMPDVIAHKGASVQKAMSHLWLTTEGVFGVALGVSTSFVFLFVLFGAMLDRAGAGAYFINVAFSLLGHMRGGPAKAAVVASGLSGLVSGSSIANVVTTGTFTIPLMKRVGFPGTKAGAVEVAASTNGQLTPPIMGAAAFLMVEYVGISYVEVIRAALLPALISYIALIYIVHLEACKAGMTGLPRRKTTTLIQSLLSFTGTILGLCVLSAIVYYGIGWTKEAFGAAATPIVGTALLVTYLLLVRVAAKFNHEKAPNIDQNIQEIPEVGPTIKSGLHYLLPIVVLVWCLTVERFSPGLSAFWATIFMIFILLTQRPLMAWFNQAGDASTQAKVGVNDLLESLVSGARNMIGIGVATAAAGTVVGVVTLTGIGLVMTDFVEFVSGGNIILMLLFTAVISLLLGMGLPTTANYIVVSTLMAPVIVTLGAQNGLIIPLIAIHLFVFYFGILADDTPPVGLAAFAAAAIAQSDPIRTGIQGFAYDIRTAILPFMFVFNTQLLLMGIDTWWHLALTIASAIIAMLLFSAATQRWWFTKTKWWEVVALLLLTFTFFRPGFWWDMIYPAQHIYPGTQLESLVEQTPVGQPLTMIVAGETLTGNYVSKTVMLPFDDQATNAAQRIASMGLIINKANNRMLIDMVEFGSPAEAAGIDFDWEVRSIIVDSDRPMKEWVFLPAIFFTLLLGWNQKRRAAKQALAA